MARSKWNRGYAFISFMDPANAVAFKSCYCGRQLGPDKRPIGVRPALLQGLEANRAQFSTAPVAQADPGARPLQSTYTKPGVHRTARAEGAVAKPAASTLKQRPRAESLTAARSSAVSTSAGGGQAFTRQNECSILDPKDGQVSFCPYCGARAGENFKFCQYCGKTLPVVPVAAPSLRRRGSNRFRASRVK